ncbi:MAG: hypothetical protein M1818_003062 [Claussenomyces sp. TS43310]|nr:MAG: hypothetical protein M1818_003062 [Claussenomyces sp. TS43310]
MGEGAEMARRMDKGWNWGLIAASIGISLLGAFTSTQLMCQARTSMHFSGVLLWTTLSSLTFGFCSIWSLHEVAMLACELDLPIGIDVPLTVLSSILAVTFTFAALGSDLLWDRYNQGPRRRLSTLVRKREQGGLASRTSSNSDGRDSSEPLLGRYSQEEDDSASPREDQGLGPPLNPFLVRSNSTLQDDEEGFAADSRHQHPLAASSSELDASQSLSILARSKNPSLETRIPALSTETTVADDRYSNSDNSRSIRGSSNEPSRQSSLDNESDASTFGIGHIMKITNFPGKSPAKNAFVATGKILYLGCTRKNIIRGFLWSLAITSMHYVGIMALRIPEGHFVLNPSLVVLSAFTSWMVCSIGCILMPQIETYLAQQLLFSAVATAGVAAMHFTGTSSVLCMQAATFWTYAPPSDIGGYPPALAMVIACIAITTCIAANALLAHSATIARNTLAQSIFTRRKLWMAIAQKESAESTAAARSEFIASASHEIRTPLHHLQGYSDLLSRTELSEESRLLLTAIQRATKTLSLITNNVLDWSRLERDGEAVCRPVALDIRTVCESIITLLPNGEDDSKVELMVVVAPEVPRALFLDETHIYRILMNLLSNALKFTSSGYILLIVEMSEQSLVATIKDTGIGIPAAFLPQLFEPFKQAQTRGTSRGTGLGLSIIKQLLHKMHGTIDVDSKHRETADIAPEECGSTFTITIPVQRSLDDQDEMINTKSSIAIYDDGDPQILDGLGIAWSKFGFDVTIVKQCDDINSLDVDYIWADLQFLKENPTTLDLLVKQNRPVLVACDTQTALKENSELQVAQQFIPIPRPFIWHSIKSRIDAANQISQKARTVRFASNVDVMEDIDDAIVEDQRLAETSTARRPVVLLVEDNPEKINRKLGTKMLSSLGYGVLVAEDGQEAVEQVSRHDDAIDAILMDQSMPRKDGLTATREIREMERLGRLSRRRPIIAVTAVVSAQARVLCTAAGTDDFLPKPLSLGKLEETLAMYLK